MCLALVAIATHPRYPLVVAANRDEFHHRPAAAAHWWPEGWLAGRDLGAGGAWLGVTRYGRWGLVTNVREPTRHDPAAPSRGALVPTFLRAGGDSASAVAATIASAGSSNGFNLVGGVRDQAAWGSNRSANVRVLPAGISGLSNAQLDTPWPKLRRATAALQGWCLAADASLDRLVDLLGDRTLAPDDELPATGVSLAWERVLSAPFIVSEAYGTRCSTVLTIDRDGRVGFVERSFAPDGSAIGEVRESFRLTSR